MNSSSVRKNISEWKAYFDQLYSLFYDEKPTEEIGVLFARGLSTPPYKFSSKERKDNYKNIEALSLMYNENVDIVIALVKGYVFWVLVQPLDSMVNWVCDFLERIAYRYVASAEVCITLSKELLRAMKDATGGYHGGAGQSTHSPVGDL